MSMAEQVATISLPEPGSEWDRGAAWIRPDRIAAYDTGDRLSKGTGEHGEPPCVRILGPTTQPGSSPDVTPQVMKTVTTFPGPDGRYFTDGGLLLVTTETGLEAWDIDSGERAYEVPDFRPDRQHQHTLELIELGERVVWHMQPRADPHREP
jgi:hypothetical protein